MTPARTACIAAGAKRQSRPRLGQSGPLTGQQYSVRQAYAKPAAAKARHARIRAQVPPPQKLTRATWGLHRGRAGVAPGQGRRASQWGRFSSLPVRAAFPPPEPHTGPGKAGSPADRNVCPTWWEGLLEGFARSSNRDPPKYATHRGKAHKTTPGIGPFWAFWAEVASVRNGWARPWLAKRCVSAGLTPFLHRPLFCS